MGGTNDKSPGTTDPADRRAAMTALGEPEYRARQVYAWLYRKRARSLEELGVVRGVVAHHQRGRRVEALHEQPAVVVDGVAGRPAHDRQAPLPQPPGRDGRSGCAFVHRRSFR